MLKTTEFERRENLYPLDYYYGGEADQFTFFRIPKALFQDPAFKTLSGDAKILYGLLLDRMSLSVRNQWLDEENRVYIYYTLKEAISDLSCSHTTGVKLFAELDKCGLIERIKQGMGQPTRIYVKNFIRKPVPMEYDSAEVMEAVERSSRDERKGEAAQSELEEVVTEKSPQTRMNTESVKTSRNWKSRLSESESQDFQNVEVKTSKNWKSRFPENGSQDFQNLEPNKTYKNYTDMNDTEYLSISQSVPETFWNGSAPVTDGTDEMDELREMVRDSIEYEALCGMRPNDVDRIDGIVELITDVVSMPDAEVRIGGTPMNHAVVQKRLLSLRAEDVQYVLERMDQGSGKEIRNIRAYLLTSLYNAPTTSAAFEAARVARAEK